MTHVQHDHGPWLEFAEMRRSRCDGITWVGRLLSADYADLADVFAGPRLRVQRELHAASDYRKVRWMQDPDDPDRFIGQQADPS